MRKDVKLGLLLSFVVVVVAGGYYIAKEKTEEPLALDGSTTPLKSQVAQATPKTHTPDAGKPKPTRGGNRTPSSQEPAAKRTTRGLPGTRSVAKRPQRESNGTVRRRQMAVPPSIKAKPRPTGETSPVTKTKQKPATPAREKPEPKPTGSNKPDRDKPAKGTFEDLFQFDESESASTKSPAAPPTAGVKPARTGSKPPAAPTRAGGERKPQPTSPGTTRTRRPPEPATAKQTTPKAEPGHRDHTVERGDSYALLADRYYGSQRYAQFLMDANPGHSDPRRLRVGAVLRIPPRPDQPEKAGAAAVKPSGRAAAPGQRTYVVREGDTFYGIAARELGSADRWTELFELNKDEVDGRPNRLRVGQILVLPPEKPATTGKEN